jgi:hypothetical protein
MQALGGRDHDSHDPHDLKPLDPSHLRRGHDSSLLESYVAHTGQSASACLAGVSNPHDASYHQHDTDQHDSKPSLSY